MNDDDVRVLTLKDNRILLVLEKGGSKFLPNSESFEKPSKWGLPGGRSEVNDKDEIAVAEREVEEEIGIFLEIDARIRVERQMLDHLKVAFAGYYKGGKIKIDPEEILEARWFPRSILYNESFSIYAIQRGMAQELLKLRR